jgi:hypothetical protein
MNTKYVTVVYKIVDDNEWGKQTRCTMSIMDLNLSAYRGAI